MTPVIAFLVRVALLACIWLVFWWALVTPLSRFVNLTVIVAGVLLTFPVVLLGRQVLDRRRTAGHAVWTTTFVHCALGFTFGVPIIRAIVTHRDWPGWVLPVPTWVGLTLVVVTGAACAVTVGNLALKGLGAPFFIRLSQRVAVDWLYAWTRNPMVLATLALSVALGIWFQSAAFVLWALVVFAPALLFFVKRFEERELELRFGASYLEYKARTPMLIPRRPKGSRTSPEA